MIRHKVRTTMRPDKEIEVTPQELADLERQGLVATVTGDDAAAAASWTPPAPPASPATGSTASPAPKPPARTRKTASGGGTPATADTTSSKEE